MQVFFNHNLEKQNTFWIAAYADTFVILENIDEIQEAIKQHWKPTHILGWWSNLLITKNIQWVVRLPNFTSIEIQDNKIETQDAKIKIGAGENRHNFVMYTIEQWLRWIENLIAIPWNIGAAPVQNIWAYGVELQDVLEEVSVFDFTQNAFAILSKADCCFGYRTSIFKEQPGRFLITHITLRLSKTPNPILTYWWIGDAIKEKYTNWEQATQLEIAQTIEIIRRSKLPHPEELGNAGSFFKNPLVTKNIVSAILKDYPTMPHFTQTIDGPNGKQELYKIPAARLLEQAWCKGFHINNVGTYEKQPLIIINLGGNETTGQEIFDFSEILIKKVYDTFWVQLEREVNVR